MEVKTEMWRDAVVVSLKGLRARSRGSYSIGMRVKAHTRACIYKPKCPGAKCPICGGTGFDTIVQGTGMGGTNTVVPDTLIRFLDK